MTDDELKHTTTAYQHIRDRFSRDEVALLYTLLYRLDQDYATAEIKQREKIKLDSFRERTAWINNKN